MTYEENVNKNAYEIALTLSSLCDNGATVSALSNDEIIQGLARDFVQREAEAFKAGYILADPTFADTDHVGFYTSEGVYKEGNLLQYELIERGLIPAPECKHDHLMETPKHIQGKICTECKQIINSPSNEQK